MESTRARGSLAIHGAALLQGCILAMRIGTICSGIGVAELAFDWCEPAFVAEIDKDANAVLKHHFPSVRNYGDITKLTEVAAADVLVAGTPCQSFSVQGARRGMDDPRGQLAMRAVDIIGQLGPRFVVWENVTGALHADRGRAFASFVTALDELGYGYAWRVLDAQYFGCAQRRKRLFVVGHSGGAAGAVDVLFEPGTALQNASALIAQRQTLASLDAANGAMAYGITGDETPKFGCEVVPTLRAAQGGEGVLVGRAGERRRLFIEEWERLQGLPVGYTAIGGLTEAKRRKLIGNAIALPVMKWIAKRIKGVINGGAANRGV